MAIKNLNFGAGLNGSFSVDVEEGGVAVTTTTVPLNCLRTPHAFYQKNPSLNNNVLGVLIDGINLPSGSSSSTGTIMSSGSLETDLVVLGTVVPSGGTQAFAGHKGLLTSVSPSGFNQPVGVFNSGPDTSGFYSLSVVVNACV